MCLTGNCDTTNIRRTGCARSAKKSLKRENEFIYHDLEEKMRGIMGTKVSVNRKSNGKGKIEIEYYSDEELERLFEMIMSIREEVR